MKKWWPLGLFLIGLSLVLLFQYQKYRVAPTMNVFELTYTDTAGKKFDLTSLKGKKIIYSFFATWCGDCLLELRQLNEARQSLPEDGVVVVVSDESLEKIAGFQRRKKYPFVFLKLAKSFGDINVNAIPVNYLINAKGEVTYSKVGAINWKDLSVQSMVEGNLR